jgi:hypothetical protein
MPSQHTSESNEGRIAEKTVGGRDRFQRNSLFNGF